MALRLFNTMSARVEEFRPIHANEVRMYACGPTVYDYGHIGNFRTFIAVDILQRFLKQSGYKLRYAMNITDVDDKIIRNSARDGVDVKQYTAKYEKAFLEDAAMLNIEQPTLVRATEHIPAMAEFIAKLEQKGLAYRTEDGSYYFRIAKFPAYGKLSKKDFAGMEDGARVDVDEYEKDNARDFALWKAPKPGEAFWETSIGRGRPGWHIECSVMSMEELGETFDLHAGGEDSDFPASRKRNRAVRVADWQDVRELLVSCALPAGRRREDVEESRQLFHAARSGAQGIQAVVDPLPADFGAVSQPAELHLGWAAAGGDVGRSFAEFSPAPVDARHFPDGTNAAMSQAGRRNRRANEGRARRRPEHGASAGSDLRDGPRRQCRHRCRRNAQGRCGAVARSDRQVRRNFRRAGRRRCARK